MPPDVLDAYPHELSGGMRQRVTIALATICEPEFIIADEPTTALDVVVQKDVLAMIREAQQQFGSSMIFVTHDLTVHANIANRLGIMYAGRLVEEAPTAELFHDAAASLHCASHRQPAADRRSQAEGVAARRATESRRSAFRLPLSSALPDGDGYLQAVASCADDGRPGRRVACYAVDPKAKAVGGTPASKITAEADSAARFGQ